MALLVEAGLVQAFVAMPQRCTVLKVVGAAYLLFLSWKITAGPPLGEATRVSQPLTFLAAAFQGVNLKAGAMALTAVSVCAPSQTMAGIGAVAIVFGMANLLSVGTWAVLGLGMRRVLTNLVRMRTFNVLMAVLLVASLYPVLLQ